jgi:hypothetical protein
MAYLIDGHNLIPRIPGMSLQNVDDEQELIARLQQFCRAQRKKVEVFFDQAPAGQAGTRRYGLVTAHFVQQASSADAAIQARLERLGRQAGQWIVVSSDRRVQGAARRARARVLSAEAFADLLHGLQAGPPADPDHKPESGEIDDWLALFGGEEPQR